MYVNLNTQIVTNGLPTWLPMPQISNPSLEQCIPYGWRVAEMPDPVASGYERGPVTWVQDGERPTVAVAQYVDSPIQVRLDAERAAKLATLTPELIQTAALYRATLRKHFGDAAETNTEVSVSAVNGYFEQKRMDGTITAVEAADALALLNYYGILSAWTGDGTTWSFPWELVQ